MSKSTGKTDDRLSGLPGELLGLVNEFAEDTTTLTASVTFRWYLTPDEAYIDEPPPEPFGNYIISLYFHVSQLHRAFKEYLYFKFCDEYGKFLENRLNGNNFGDFETFVGFLQNPDQFRMPCPSAETQLRRVRAGLEMLSVDCLFKTDFLDDSSCLFPSGKFQDDIELQLWVPRAKLKALKAAGKKWSNMCDREKVECISTYSIVMKTESVPVSDSCSMSYVKEAAASLGAMICNDLFRPIGPLFWKEDLYRLKTTECRYIKWWLNEHLEPDVTEDEDCNRVFKVPIELILNTKQMLNRKGIAVPTQSINR